MLNLPYGISDFYKIRTEGYHYIDRTSCIPLVEAAGMHLVFLRPRRFGKSLWLSTLENYYDVAKAPAFEQLFGDLAIGQNPTPRRNSYFILRWDFSLVSPQGEVEQISQALHAHMNTRIQAFAQTYQAWLNHPITILPENAIASFESLVAAVAGTPQRLYLLIDEYDNFANEVLMSRTRAGSDRYETLLYGEGLLKTVFKAVKGAGSGMGLDRVFTTGVAPIVLSDLSSGYNVAENITMLPDYTTLCGFTQDEVKTLWAQIAEHCGVSAAARDETLELMRTYYNGYRFDPRSSALIYNPTLTFYFLKAFQRDGSPPQNLLDTNLAMDRGKIAYIAALPNSAPVLAAALDEANPPVIDMLAQSFGVADVLDQAKDATFMVSLLYYFGVLTLDGYTEMVQLRFRVPNLVVRSLYAEQLRTRVLPAHEQQTASAAAQALFHRGELQPLCEFIETTYFRALDNRDYRWANELTVKMAFLTLLFNDRLYVVDSEPALERSYADLTLLVRPDLRSSALQDALLEFKYLPLSELRLSSEAAKTTPREELAALPLVQTRLAEATQKAEAYRAILQNVYGASLRLHTYAIVALGFDRLVWVKL
ncbi:AAA family ATPase [Candidatus Viridilinea mediisalina]|uniref:AAA family ATPase n=1 Tax=Candidatus Viridilinea mediisalina TaxID=2024553 RepID=A0A2A6RM41_9CHLR|nr:AAA family ATPase [Candidatus Viridilinea mediisalina]PDW03948.1 AAA family ATPase [Candidatus Viridilinea mediisalina]